MKLKRITAVLLAGALMLGLMGCSGIKNNDPVKIATKPMTEQYILGGDAQDSDRGESGL